MGCCKDKQKGCQKPENLKDKPEKCSPEQIEICHGDGEHHNGKCENDHNHHPCTSE